MQVQAHGGIHVTLGRWERGPVYYAYCHADLCGATLGLFIHCSIGLACFIEFLRPGVQGFEGGIEAVPHPVGGGEMPPNPMVKQPPPRLFWYDGVPYRVFPQVNKCEVIVAKSCSAHTFGAMQRYKCRTCRDAGTFAPNLPGPEHSHRPSTSLFITLVLMLNGMGIAPFRIQMVLQHLSVDVHVDTIDGIRNYRMSGPSPQIHSLPLR